MQCGTASDDDNVQPDGSAFMQSQGFRGSKQRPQSAQAAAKRPLSGSSKAPRRPQSATTTAVTPPAVTPTAQPPFWTGCMQQHKSSHPLDEGFISDAHSHDTWQQPRSGEDGVGVQQPAGQQGRRERPQSASPGHAPSVAGASSRGMSGSASSPCTALRTVPEDAAALQPGKPLFQHATLPESRAGSLRAWRGMYTQASTSQTAPHGEKGQNNCRQPGSASLQQKASCPSSATRPHSAARSSSASRPNSAQGQVVQQRPAGVQRGFHSPTLPKPGWESLEKKAGSEGGSEGQDNLARCNLQACVLPRTDGKSPVAEDGAGKLATALDLTEAER